MSDAPSGHPRDLLSAYVDDELGYDERATIDRHLAECDECRREIGALRLLTRAIADENVPPVPVDLAARIGKRLDDATIVRSRSWRFVVPATIAATLAAIGILVTVQWREGRLPAPTPREPEPKSRAQDEAKPVDVPPPPAAAQPPPVAPQPQVSPPREKEADRRDALEKDLKRNVEPNVEGVPGGAVGGVAGGSEGAVSTDDEARGRAARKASEVGGLARQAPAARMEELSLCGDRWSDSGVHGSWDVPDAHAAVGELDRIARDVGGVGDSRGVADSRPYVLVVPRDRFDEVLSALRARGVTRLAAPPALEKGDDCAAISVALTVVAVAPSPPR